MIRLPGFRRELILDMKALADLEYQKRKWASTQYTHPFWDHLDLTVEVIFDIHNLDKNPEQQIGDILRNQAEVDAIKPVVKALEAILDTIGIEQPDSAYINSPLWEDVVKAAKHAYEVLMKDEDLDALLEAEENRH
jgi:hypothetical protein